MENASITPKLSIHVPKSILYNILRTEFWFFEFELKKTGFRGPWGPFLAKNHQKRPPRSTKPQFFQLELKKSKFCTRNIVEGTLGYMYTQFESDRCIFHRLDTFSVENRVPKKRRAIRAKWSFFGQKSANFQNFSKSFQNLIKPIEIHFWSKNQLIWSIFGHFMAI